MAQHTHRARTGGKEYRSAPRVRCWTHCVTPVECAARPARQRAHGNIIATDTCSCGATRQSETNAGRTNYGPWLEAEVQSGN